MDSLRSYDPTPGLVAAVAVSVIANVLGQTGIALGLLQGGLLVYALWPRYR